MKLKKFLTKIYKGDYIELIKDGKRMGVAYQACLLKL